MANLMNKRLKKKKRVSLYSKVGFILFRRRADSFTGFGPNPIRVGAVREPPLLRQ